MNNESKTERGATTPHTTLRYAVGFTCLIALLYLVSSPSKHHHPEGAIRRFHHESLGIDGELSLDIMMFKNLFQYANGRNGGWKTGSRLSNPMSS